MTPERLPFIQEPTDPRVLLCAAICECGQINKLYGYNDHSFMNQEEFKQFRCVKCERKYLFRWNPTYLEIVQVL